MWANRVNLKGESTRILFLAPANGGFLECKKNFKNLKANLKVQVLVFFALIWEAVDMKYLVCRHLAHLRMSQCF